MLWQPACKQLTLVQSDISPIDIASYLYLLSTLSLLHVVGIVISNNNGLKRKLKVSTVDIQIKRSGLRISNSKVFSSGHRKFEFVAKVRFLCFYNFRCGSILKKGFWYSGSSAAARTFFSKKWSQIYLQPWLL